MDISQVTEVALHRLNSGRHFDPSSGVGLDSIAKTFYLRSSFKGTKTENIAPTNDMPSESSKPSRTEPNRTELSTSLQHCDSIR